MDELQDAKARCRTVLRARLSAMTADQRVVESREICARVRCLAGFAEASALVLYRALPTEVDLMPLAVEAMRNDTPLYFPRVDSSGQLLQFVRVRQGTQWRRTKLGVEEPTADECLAAAAIPGAVVMVPGLGFTRAGDRIGRGRGFYDRALADPLWAKIGLRAGMAFVGQLLDEIPTGPTDRPVDVVVTPTKTWRGGLPLGETT